MERLLEAPDAETRLGRRDRAVLETLYATGCRASEVAGSRPIDLDLKSGLARCIGKGNKERRVPLGSRAIAALDAYLRRDRPCSIAAAPETATVFVSKSGRPLSRIGLWSIVKRWARAAGLPGDDQPAHPPPQLRHPPARRAAPTCAPSRRCSATPRSPRRRSIPGSS